MRAIQHRRLLGRPNRGEGDSIVTLSHKEIRERGLTGGGKGDGETLVMQGQEGRGRQGLRKILCPSFHLIEEILIIFARLEILSRKGKYLFSW